MGAHMRLGDWSKSTVLSTVSGFFPYDIMTIFRMFNV
jgi:hypothetical protein